MLRTFKEEKKKKKESGSKEIEEQTSPGVQLLRSSNKMLKTAYTQQCPVSSPARAAAQVSKRKRLVRYRPAPARPAASCPVGSLQVQRTHCQAAPPLLPALLADHLLPGAFTRGAGIELAAALWTRYRFHSNSPRPASGCWLAHGCSQTALPLLLSLLRDLLGDQSVCLWRQETMTAGLNSWQEKCFMSKPAFFCFF